MNYANANQSTQLKYEYIIVCNLNGILYRSLLRSLIKMVFFCLLQTGCPDGAAYSSKKVI